MQNNDFNTINPDGVSYVDIKNLIKVFSSTEYDSLEKAASEIVDNAIDAGAKNIMIFLRSAYDVKKGKNVLSEIAFLDDGEGMSPGVLQHVVGFGSTSRTTGGKIGKFGIGMNQASLFACKKFDVYSWCSENDTYLESFDSEYIIKNNIDKAAPPIKTNLPKYVTESSVYKQYAKKHGTLIVWSNFKENKLAKPVTIAKRMKNEFGRVYRNYLNSGELRIYTEADFLDCIHAIDPMFLLENTDVLGDPNGHSIKCAEGEPLFELFSHDMLDNGCKVYEVPYYDKGIIKYSKVILRASIIKEKFYYKAAYKDNIKQPGDTEIGSYVKEFQKGITVIRNNREIDFNYFGFYDSTNQPQDRWFKLEIIFNEELDDAFHVSNNKQHVELKRISDSKLPDYKEDDPNYPMWLRLKKDIDKLLAAMRNRNKALATKAKSELVNKKEDDIFVENIPEVKEERLEDFLQPFNGDEENTYNNPINADEVIHIESTDIKSENKVNIKENDIKQPIIEKRFYSECLEKENIIVFEDVLDEKIKIECNFDFESKKYFVVFNASYFKLNFMDDRLVVILSILVKDLKKAAKGSERYDTVKDLLDKYFKIVGIGEM